MADTKSSKETKPEEVTLTNVSRRPLLVRLPGKTLRLGPGDRHTVAKSMLATGELLRMCEQRFVAVSPVPEPKAEVTVANVESPAVSLEPKPDAPAIADRKPPVEAVESAVEEDTVTEKVNPKPPKK
jgi:hypothetical protein